MKKRFLLLTTLLSITLSGCGGCNSETNATLDTSLPVETASPEPTVEPTTEPTVEPTTTESTERGTVEGHEVPVDEPTEENIDLSKANDEENIVDEGYPEEEAPAAETPAAEEKPAETETPAETPAAETPAETPAAGFKLSEGDIMLLKEVFGATDAQIQGVKSQNDLDKLVYELMQSSYNSGSSTGSSSSGSSGSSGSSSGGSIINESREGCVTPELDPDDGSHPGSM